MSIEVRNVSKSFGRFRALDDVSLRVETGRLVALLGPSGCGKTTLLRIIAGLEHVDPGDGRVMLDGEDVTRKGPASRGVGFVFQHYALFRHMTISENVAFGLAARPRAKRMPADEIRSRVQALLDLVQIDFLAHRYPDELSGGQRQRVALARALAVEPKVLLLDEPFGALDAKVRRELRRWLRRLHDELHVTSLFVTHDQEEALEVADQIVLIDRGRIEQTGSPAEIYDHPASAFAYHFLGHANLFSSVASGGHVTLGGLVLDAAGAPDGDQVTVCSRPHELELHPGALPGALAASVRQVLVVGPTVRLEVAVHGVEQPAEVELSRDRFARLRLAPGDAVWVTLKSARVFLDQPQRGEPAP